MKLGVIVGHNSANQGAVRPDTGETEYQFNSRLAERMVRIAAGSYGETECFEVRAFYRQPDLPFPDEIARVYGEADQWGADLTLELHFNSFSDPSARGCEMLSSGTELSLRAAHEIQEVLVEGMGFEDRGVKTRRPKARGGESLHAGVAPAVLAEPFFGTSPTDGARVDQEDEEFRLATLYLLGAERAFSAFPNTDHRPPFNHFQIHDDRPKIAARRAPKEGVFARVMRGLGFEKVRK